MKKIKIFTNPFAVIQDRTLLTIGLLTFVTGIIAAYSMHIEMQILRVNPLSTLTFNKVLFNHTTIVIVLTLSFFGIGKIINKKTRFIDILNTVFIALIPLYISLFQNIDSFLLKETQNIEKAIKDGSIYTESPPFLFILVGLIGLGFFVYYIYLLFTGFKTATNAKKIWHYVLFFVTLIVADILTSSLIHSL